MANPLTLTSATFDTTGQKFGTAAISGGYGLTSAQLISGLPFAWECRFKISAAPAGLQVVVGGNTLGWIGVTTAGKVQFEIAAGNGSDATTFTSSGTVTDGLWHTASLSANATSYTGTLDGVVVGTANLAGGPAFTFTTSGTPDGSSGSSTGYFGVRNHSGNTTTFEFSGEVDEVSVWYIDKFPGAYTPNTTPYTGSENGLLALWHLDSNGVDSTAANVRPPNDPGLVYSPGTWLVTAAAAKTVNAGAYHAACFTGNLLELNFDVSADTAPAPEIYVSVDGGPRQQFTLAPSLAVSIPTADNAWAQHHYELEVKSTSEFNTRWSPQNTAVVLTGVTLGAGGVLSAPAVRDKTVWFYGDSITEGRRTVSTPVSGSDTDSSDAITGWAYRQRSLLGAEVGIIGWSAAGVTVGGEGGVPALGTSYNQLWSGQARSFLPAPDMIVVNYGTNDSSATASAFQSAFQTVLSDLLTATPSTTKIMVMRPFNGTQASAIQAAISITASARVIYVDTTGWFDTTLSSDGTHPLGVANLKRIGPNLATVLAPFLGRGTALPLWSYA